MSQFFTLWFLATTTLTACGLPPLRQPLDLSLVEVSTEPALIELDLVREEQAMGQPRPILVKEGTLSNAGPRLFCPPDVRAPDAGLRLEMAQGTRLCVLRTDFTLHPLDGGKEFRRLIVRLGVESRGVEMLDLYPRALLHPEDKARSLGLSVAGAQFIPLPDGSPHPGLFSVVDLQPVITGHRETGPAAYWILTSPQGPVPIGMRSVFALVNVPAKLSSLAGSIQYESDIGAHIFGIFRMPGTAKTQSVKFEIRLVPVVVSERRAPGGPR